jgi:hypothetical protein
MRRPHRIIRRRRYANEDRTPRSSVVHFDAAHRRLHPSSRRRPKPEALSGDWSPSALEKAK